MSWRGKGNGKGAGDPRARTTPPSHPRLFVPSRSGSTPASGSGRRTTIAPFHACVGSAWGGGAVEIRAVLRLRFLLLLLEEKVVVALVAAADESEGQESWAASASVSFGACGSYSPPRMDSSCSASSSSFPSSSPSSSSLPSSSSGSYTDAPITRSPSPPPPPLA